ncbi:MAG: EAL domain-containing response regulator [Pseudomonadales bacterium]|jgi:EAL domain-containing protein (putative c-di-GMP-specific phosphodiesterase class I)/FixJ family two-component response regulator|tara:strand:+ start:282 stop:1469 length:1188 start_codon:yes stop_codon:yes gene_type:complete
MSKEWKSLKILIVDDDSFQRTIVTKVLNLLGITDVASAADGRGAEARLAEPWDLLILDLNMPGMDGIEFLNVLADHALNPALIFFSGEDHRLLEVAEDLAKDLGIRVLGSISKPIDRSKIETLLQRVELKTAPATQASAQSELSEAEIRTGITAGAIRLVYQPKVDAVSLDMIGVEALLRWETPEGQLLGPGAVVPVAERSGLMFELTQAIFRIAMNQLSQWCGLGYRWKVSCNFSVSDLTEPSVVSVLDDALTATSVPAELVILEVTESKLPEDVASVMSSLTRMRLKGCGISIDDFGTGFSSMEQLRRFPFTELKIDRAFVNGAHAKPSAKAIFESSVDLARRLGMSSVAEGVEDEADLALCRALGVDLIQGYYIARPMFPEAVVEWARVRGH